MEESFKIHTYYWKTSGFLFCALQGLGPNLVYILGPTSRVLFVSPSIYSPPPREWKLMYLTFPINFFLWIKRQQKSFLLAT